MRVTNTTRLSVLFIWNSASHLLLLLPVICLQISHLFLLLLLCISSNSFFSTLFFFFLCALVCYTSPTPKKGNKNLFWLPLSRRVLWPEWVSVWMCVVRCVFLLVFLPLNQIFLRSFVFFLWDTFVVFSSFLKKKIQSSEIIKIK